MFFTIKTRAPPQGERSLGSPKNTHLERELEGQSRRRMGGEGGTWACTMASSRPELQPAGSQLLLDFECWISHCRVMSAKGRGGYSLSLPSSWTWGTAWVRCSTPAPPRGTPRCRHSPMLSFSLQEME